jgi:ATP-dependent RNA helicase DeaD
LHGRVRHILTSGKDAKESEQSSIDYSLPAYKFVPSISLQHCFRILYGLLLILPVWPCACEELHYVYWPKGFFMPTFNDFSLLPVTLAALASMKFTEPTPIQAEAIPALLAGKDFIGQSITGSGKTLAYGVPLLERVARDKRVTQALILVPTRELAIQVNAVLSQLASSRRLTIALLVGGRPYGSQISALRYGSQIVIGTPGRVKDHLDRGTLTLNNLRICVLDEADQMLDSGFAPAVEEILSTTPDTRQTALFSATIPDWVATLEEKFLKNPVKVDLTPAIGTQSSIEQIAYQVPQEKKIAALSTLLHSSQGESSLIFGRTKYGVEKLGKHLTNLGFTVGTLHGNKSQRQREEVLTAFRRGQVQTLLATNVAARGLDISDIYQVINYELPESSELFTHRIGRTGRMGKQGKAITLLAPSELPKWRRMARDLGQSVALERLVIDEQATTTPPPARPEAPATLEHEQLPVQSRQHVAPGRERERRKPAQSERYDQAAPSPKRQQKDGPTRKKSASIPAWETEDFFWSERPQAAGTRNGRRKPRAFTPVEPRRQPARTKSTTRPVARTRRPASSKRFASR